MQSIAHTHKGLRPTNQDAFYTSDDLFIVCDGVGGKAYGEVASKLACSSIADYFKQSPTVIYDCDYLNKALQYTIQQFQETENKYPELKNMATTVVLIAFDSDGAIIAWIGDSRLYHIRKGQILFMTEDHSLINELAKQGKDVSDIKQNIITKSVSANGKTGFSCQILHKSEIQQGDFFFLCTDGVLENITNEKINRIFSLDSALERIKEQIIKECEGKTNDNFTFEIIHHS